MNDPRRKYRVVVLLSGSGSNFAAIASASLAGRLPIEIAAVLSDRPMALGLERARTLGIPALALSPKDYPDRGSHDHAMQLAIDQFQPDLVVCAGYMRIFSASFVRHFAGKMLNIHPSLLPAYKGLDTHRRVLADGAATHGCSVHYVTEELDGGPVVGQASVAVLAGDTEESLAQRVHHAEHRLYPEVINWCATGRLRLDGQEVLLDGKPLSQPVLMSYADADL